MNLRTRLGYQVGLIGFIRLSVVLRLTHLLPTVSVRRIGRIAAIALGSIASAPLGLWERIVLGHAIRDTQIETDPVFIIGHWRSGTTHLHNLLSRDPQFGSLRMFQTLTPDCSLSTASWLPRWLQKAMPLRRPMDQMEWPMDAPQEEEIALAKMTPYSWYLSFLFPRQAIASLDRFVLFRNAPESIRREVRRSLLRVYQIATLHAGGRRLLLKNPVHTCRIPLLLSLFPNAKFIFIHRSPVEVYDSTMNLHRKILELTSLQEFDDAQIDHNVIELHRRVTATYLTDRTEIPSGQLVEIPYDALVEKPAHTLQQIYSSLGLAGWERAEKGISEHLSEQADYQRNQFERDPEKTERIEILWSEDYSAWNYPRTRGSSLAD